MQHGAKNWIFLWFDKKGLLACWLASSLVTVIILGSKEKKRKEEEEEKGDWYVFYLLEREEYEK